MAMDITLSSGANSNIDVCRDSRLSDLEDSDDAVLLKV